MTNTKIIKLSKAMNQAKKNTSKKIHKLTVSDYIEWGFKQTRTSKYRTM